MLDEYLPLLVAILRQYKRLHVNIYRKNTHLKLTKLLNKTERAFEIRCNELRDAEVDQLETTMAALDAAISQDGMVDSDFEIEQYST